MSNSGGVPVIPDRLAEVAEAIHANVENGPWMLIQDPDLRTLVREYVADACHSIAAAAGLDGAMEAAHAACPVRLATALPTPAPEESR
jgi:hypothetical protein